MRRSQGSSSGSRSGRVSYTPDREPMPLDRKLDILGVFLLFVGIVTLLLLFSSSHNALTGGWLNILERLFGWGMYLFPIGLAAIGLWLVLRYFESVPRLAPERLFGLLLLFLNLLTWLHLFSRPADAFALAAQGGGGGTLGAFFYQISMLNLGLAGTLVLLLAWLLLALALSLDISVVDLFRWMPRLVEHVQDGVQDWLDERRNRYGPLPTHTPGLSRSSMPPVDKAAPAIPAVPLAPPGQPRPWVLPSVQGVLDPGSDVAYDDDYDRSRARVIEETLKAFGAPVNVVEINRGPVITQFGVEPAFIETRNGRMRVRVGKIASLVDDLALALSARTIRVQAPVPGKGYVGIEVPNTEIATVALRDVIESEAFKRLKSPLRFALGQDVAGNAVAADLSAMPHLLIAGATGSGKSVCVNALISCLLLHNTPDDLRLIMVDPKRVELTGYNGIPHLLAPVVVDMERVTGALQWVLREMDMRYHKLAQAGTRNINEFNNKAESIGEKKLPRLIVFIDELADLMMLSPDETERTITRLAQLARATGIHLVIATQRPSVEVVTGVIKANFPSRIAFAVASNVDSRVILDQPGAERLLGRGDMLFQAPDSPSPLRMQGAFVSDNEIQRLVSYWQSFQSGSAAEPLAPGIVDAIPGGLPLKQMPLWEAMQAEEDQDPLLNEAIDLSRRQGRASISMLQRRLRIGYTRSARLVESMQDKGIIGKESGPQGFEILDYGAAAPPVDEL
jgi:S-DNA-T family DNA segregation ATPase FtsK/SpoIIIE